MYWCWALDVKHLALPFWWIHLNSVVLHIRKPVLQQKKKKLLMIMSLIPESFLLLCIMLYGTVWDSYNREYCTCTIPWILFFLLIQNSVWTQESRSASETGLNTFNRWKSKWLYTSLHQSFVVNASQKLLCCFPIIIIIIIIFFFLAPTLWKQSGHWISSFSDASAWCDFTKTKSLVPLGLYDSASVHAALAYTGPNYTARLSFSTIFLCLISTCTAR